MAIIQASVSNAPIIERRSYLDAMLGRLAGLGQLGAQVMQALAYQNQIKAQQQQNWNTAFQKALTMDKTRGAVLLRGVGAPDSVIQQYMAMPDTEYLPGLAHQKALEEVTPTQITSKDGAGMMSNGRASGKATATPATNMGPVQQPQTSAPQYGGHTMPDFNAPPPAAPLYNVMPPENASSAVPPSPLSQTQDAVNFMAALAAPSFFGGYNA